MKKRILTAAVLSALILTACGNTANEDADTSSADTSASQTELSEETSETTKAPETEEEFHQAMIARSVLSTGNNTRLKAKLQQLRDGTDTTISYIGGSITYGVGATPETCWAKLSFNDIAEKYGTGSNAHYINAGISGTPSVLGNLRAGRDIPDSDIVFIEFAVNDAQDKLHKESYESLVKTLLTQDNAPAVILVINRTMEGYSCQEYMSQIAERYGLPVISVNDAITAEIDGGRMTWEDYSADKAHPNPYGHTLIEEMVDNMFDVIDNEEPDEEYTVPEAPVFDTPYMNAKLATPENAEDNQDFSITELGEFTPINGGVYGFDTSYAHDGNSEGSMKIKLKASSFFIVYKRNNSDTLGSIDVYLDGEKLKTINANDPDGWGDPYAVQVIKFQKSKDMDIEIKMSEGSEDKEFYIFGIGYINNED